jgi:hypothetical protein
MRLDVDREKLEMAFRDVYEEVFKLPDLYRYCELCKRLGYLEATCGLNIDLTGLHESENQDGLRNKKED